MIVQSFLNEHTLDVTRRTRTRPLTIKVTIDFCVWILYSSSTKARFSVSHIKTNHIVLKTVVDGLELRWVERHLLAGLQSVESSVCLLHKAGEFLARSFFLQMMSFVCLFFIVMTFLRYKLCANFASLWLSCLRVVPARSASNILQLGITCERLGILRIRVLIAGSSWRIGSSVNVRCSSCYSSFSQVNCSRSWRIPLQRNWINR